MTDKYVVVGNPIAQSKSPDIHALFAAQTQQDIHYDRLLVEPGDFDRAIRQFFADGGKGLNVTAPFKGDAHAFADVLSDEAKLAGAVNTLSINREGKIKGDTTDGLGLVSDILRVGWCLQGQRILIIGAGGAVRGVMKPILDRAPASVFLVNRTESKAQAIADLFPNENAVTAGGFDALVDQHFDLIINGSSAGLSGQLPAVPGQVITNANRIYDMSYAAQHTPFLAWAEKLGATELCNGLGMLVGQAAESFYIWRGVRPKVEPVIAALKAQLS